MNTTLESLNLPDDGKILFRNENYEEGTMDVLHYYQNEFSDDEDLPFTQNGFYEEDVDFQV